MLCPPWPARKTKQGRILLNSLYCRNTSHLDAATGGPGHPGSTAYMHPTSWILAHFRPQLIYIYSAFLFLKFLLMPTE